MLKLLVLHYVPLWDNNPEQLKEELCLHSINPSRYVLLIMLLISLIDSDVSSSARVFPISASPVTAMHRWWGESSSYVLLHLKSALMARKAYILFPNEANHSGGFAPHSLNPSPYEAASGASHMHTHVTVEVTCLSLTYSNGKTTATPDAPITQ